MWGFIVQAWQSRWTPLSGLLDGGSLQLVVSVDHGETEWKVDVQQMLNQNE